MCLTPALQVEVREYKGLEATTLGQGYPALKTDTTLQWVSRGAHVCREVVLRAVAWQL